MKRSRISILLIALFSASLSKAQHECPYNYNWKKDGTITGSFLAGGIYGLVKMSQRQDNDTNFIKNLTTSGMGPLDRAATKQNDKNSDNITDALLGTSILLPFSLFFNKDVRQDAGKITMLYLETMIISGGIYSLSAGYVKKFRPNTYNPEFSLKNRASNSNTFSFFAGHTAITATGTFFAAKVYSDYFPDSHFKYVAWGLASAATITSGYYRFRKGYHFPLDIAVGVGIGTLSGILIPCLHKERSKQITITPFIGEYKGLSFIYKMKK